MAGGVRGEACTQGDNPGSTPGVRQLPRPVSSDEELPISGNGEPVYGQQSLTASGHAVC